MDDLPIATLRPNGSSFDIFYVHADQLGTPRAVTRPSDNAIVWRWDNTEVFGNSAPNENPSGLGTFAFNLRFPGQYFDAETGTHYNYMRDYDARIGRYLQSDPIGLRGGINTYAYVKGQPLTLTDRFGLDSRGGGGGGSSCKNIISDPVSPFYHPNWVWFCVWICKSEWSCPPKVYFRSAVIFAPLHVGCGDQPPAP